MRFHPAFTKPPPDDLTVKTVPRESVVTICKSVPEICRVNLGMFDES